MTAIGYRPATGCNIYTKKKKKKSDLIYDLLCLPLGHAGQCLRECKSFVLSLRCVEKKVLQLVEINWSVLSHTGSLS